MRSERAGRTRPSIDLNSDLGEGFGIWTLGDDEALLDIVTSANVACGFHAGDPNILRRVCDAAAEPRRGDRCPGGLPRPGRLRPPQHRRRCRRALTNDVIYQIGALDGVRRVAGTRVRYVKPHGALYNRTVHDEEQAAAVVAAVVAYDPALPLLGLPGSALLRHAEQAGLYTVTEAFADRGYTAQATLVPRSQPGALLHDPAEVAERMVQMLITGRVQSRRRRRGGRRLRGQSACTGLPGSGGNGGGRTKGPGRGRGRDPSLRAMTERRTPAGLRGARGAGRGRRAGRRCLPGRAVREAVAAGTPDSPTSSTSSRPPRPCWLSSPTRPASSCTAPSSWRLCRPRSLGTVAASDGDHRDPGALRRA